MPHRFLTRMAKDGRVKATWCRVPAKGIFPISQGDAGLIDDGREVAYHGCKVACGAVLISSQMFTTTVPTSGAASGGASDGADEGSAALGFGAIGAGLVAAYQDEIAPGSQHYRGRFQVLDQATGKPVSNLQSRVRSTQGQHFMGATDADGFTQWVERDETEALAFDLVQPEQ